MPTSHRLTNHYLCSYQMVLQLELQKGSMVIYCGSEFKVTACHLEKKVVTNVLLLHPASTHHYLVVMV